MNLSSPAQPKGGSLDICDWSRLRAKSTATLLSPDRVGLRSGSRSVRQNNHSSAKPALVE